MWHDVVFSWRALARRPGLIALSVLTLAIGIGATTALYSVVHGVLLRPFPYRDADRLAVLWHVFGEGAQDLPAMHPLDFRDYGERASTLEALTIATGRQSILGDSTEPEIVQLGAVHDTFFPFLGVEPALGRHFRPDENVPGAPPVMLLGDELWRRRFGADPNVVGRRVDLDGVSTEIVGVLPAGFHLSLPAETYALRHSDVWRPVQINYDRLPPRNFTGYTVFARLAQGATFAQAQEELSGIAMGLRAEVPVYAASNLRVKVIPYHTDVVKGHRSGLWALMGAVLAVLTIACANVALLMLGRASERERELLIRTAVGGTRGRLARLAFAECAVIAAVGGLAGLLLARGVLTVIDARVLAGIPRIGAVSVDIGVAAFASAATVLSALLFGLLPALRASRIDVAEGLRAGAVVGPTRHRRTFRDALVVAQVALGVVLAIGAGLVTKSFRALAEAQPGFVASNVLTMRVATPGQGLTLDAAAAFHEALSDRIAALPGVTSVGAVSLLPLSGQGPLQPYAYDEETARQWEQLSADELSVTPGYFTTIGATMAAGRDFTSDDVHTRRRVVVVDDSLAARAFGGSAQAIGRRLQLEQEGTPESFFEIVGVVRHMRYHDLRRAMLPQIYQPGLFARFSLAVRSNGAPTALADDVRRIAAEIRPGTAVQDVRPMDGLVADALGATIVAAALMSAFSLVALGLAAIGVFGALSYFVSERTREFAVRLAVGASPAGIRRLVMTRCTALVALGLGIGLAGAAAIGSVVGALLYDVTPFDAPTYGLATAVLAIVAYGACAAPALRASRVDPMIGLQP